MLHRIISRVMNASPKHKCKPETQMQTLNANPKNKCDYCQTFVSQPNDCNTTHETYFHAHRPNCRKIIYLTQQFVKCNNSIHPIKRDCCKTNEKCLIVATINPISCSHPVHHGTFSKFSFINFVAVKARKTSSLHPIIPKQNANEATCCLHLQ